jgi:hypothetical protein
MNEWQVLELKFRKAFVNYAEHKKANNKLRKLSMKEGSINTYIACFKQLAHKKGYNVNKLEVLKNFQLGLSQQLAYTCLN